MRRMDRYQEETTHMSRLDKNKELYQNVSSNSIYTNITDVTNANAFEINNLEDNSKTTREAYQKMRKYQDIEPTPKNKKELEDFNYLYQKQENKVYDINSVLEQARKNRQDKDELDDKRKLKNNSYNILAGINKKELEKYREEKKKRILTPEEEEIRDIIDTIASKTLAGEIDKETTVDLLSDLMATNLLDKVDGMEAKEEDEAETTEEITSEEEITKEKAIPSLNQDQIEEIEKRKDEDTDTLPGKDNDFYTRSMDLSDKDFEYGDSDEKSLPLILKILIFLIIIGIIAVTGYFVYQRMF